MVLNIHQKKKKKKSYCDEGPATSSPSTNSVEKYQTDIEIKRQLRWSAPKTEEVVMI